MTVLIRQAHIKDIHSVHHNSILDILIQDGRIIRIDKKIDEATDRVIDLNGKYCSPGWTDIFVTGTDPGYEFKDDLDSVSSSAQQGGYTHLFLTPNTQPVTHSKTGVQYITERKSAFPVALHPIGAVTKNTDGKELTEMFDMRQSGAIAFGDGTRPIQSAGILIKALQYVNAFDGVIIQLPDDRSVAPHGLMHEGVVSTVVGLPGKPALAEEIMVARDIEIARYTDAHLHLTGITLASTVAMIKSAKDQGLKITCSTSPQHLTFTDEQLLRGYDTNFKSNPPFRSEKDRLALIEAVKSGVIDCVTTHHTAQHKDAKVCEFEYAGNGMIGLESAFGVLGKLGFTIDQVLQAICSNPARIFGIPSGIKEGNMADLTFFDPGMEKTFTAGDIKSKSANSPYIGQKLKGIVIGTVLGDKINLL